MDAPGLDESPGDLDSRAPAERIPYPYQSLDEGGRIRRVNTAWLEALGYERSQVLGEPFTTVLSSNAAENFEERFRRFKDGGRIEDEEIEMVRADDSTITVSFAGVCEYDDGGDFVRTHCQFRDITAYKETERKLRHQRDRLRGLTGAIPDIVFLYDRTGTVEEILTGREGLLVQDSETLVGKSVWETVNESAAEKIQGAIDHTLGTGSLSSIEYQLEIGSDPTWFEGRAVPLQTADADKVVFTARDITTRKAQEAELRQTKERLELAVEGANLGVWDWDMETDAVSRHANLREMLGYTRAEFGGTLADWEELVHPEGAERHDRALEAHVAGETEMYECEYRLRTKDGAWKWIRNIGRVVEWNAEGSPKRAVGIHIDIDEQKRLLKELRQKTDQLEALNRIVRHDIRNEVNVIHGWAQELERSVGPEAADALDRILDGSKHISELTKTAREFLETLAGEEGVGVGPVSLHKHLTSEIEAQAATYPTATFSTHGEIPAVEVRANEMLSSVFRNLLSNAVQHNDSAEPRVVVAAEERAETVRVRVEDNGPGIPEAQKDQVFGRNEKGLESEGTGIGLYLVAELLAEYDGDIWIEDAEPTGAAFVVELHKADTVR
jgi:PAS domain S-box-containing protein